MRCLPMVTKELTVAALMFLGSLAPPASAQCQRAKLSADDGAAGDQFGRAVDVSGNAALVGARGNDQNGPGAGAVYVFHRAGGVWLLGMKLTPEGGVAGDLFGHAVALSEGLALVGAPYRNDFGPRSGAAYVFECVDGAYLEAAKLLPDDAAEHQYFGYGVALSGDVAAVGAPEDRGLRGAVYVFERDPNDAWPQAAKLVANDGLPYDTFGEAVAIDGDVIVIGAPNADDLGNWSGKAYVFERDTSGNWSQTTKLLPDGGQGFWFFGASVAVSGSAALVGARGADVVAPSAGAAYVFERDQNGTWVQTAEMLASDGANSDKFGASVALSGDVAVIGAWADDEHGEHTGAAYVFVREPDGRWTQVAKLLADDGSQDDRFGNAVGISGNLAVIGAYRDDDHGTDSGSAYVFAVGPDDDGDGIMDVCLCPGDLDHDWDVDVYDLVALLMNYGTTSGATYEDGDLDEDGDVDLADLSTLLTHYGEPCQ